VKKALLALIVLAAGCGSSSDQVTSPASFAPTAAVASIPASDPVQVRELVGQLEGDRGTFDVQVTQTGSELQGVGFVTLGQEVRSVVAEGTLDQDRLGLQLYPEIALPGSRPDIISIAGDLGGSGAWEEEGDGPDGACTLREVSDAEIRARLLDGQRGSTIGREVFSVQVRQDTGPIYDFTVTLGKYDPIHKVFKCTWQSNRPIGPWRGELKTSGQGYASNFGFPPQIRLTLQVPVESLATVITCVKPADRKGATQDCGAKVYVGADGSIMQGVLRVVENDLIP